MSRDAAPGTCNRALRLALAVSLGLSAEILRGALLPPLAPVIALQLLALPGGAPGRRLVVGLFGVAAVASLAAYAVAALTADSRVLYALGVGLVYLWGFALALRPRTAAAGAMALTMGVSVTALAAASTGLALLVVAELLAAIILGIALVYLAHAVFPAPPAAPGARSQPAGRRFLGQAVLATLVMLPLHLWLTAGGAAALVVLLTVATMLRQPGVAQSVGYGVNVALGNLIGGALASVAVLAVAVQTTAPVLVAAVSAGAMLMAGLLARHPARAGVLLPGFVAFTLLFGLAFTAIAPSAEVALAQRVAYIVLAALYALAAISLAAPFFRMPRPSPAKGP